MELTIVGSGNVGTVLGRSLKQKGFSIRQVYSRNPTHAAELAGELNAEAVADLSLIDDKADIYLVTVTDDAIQAVAGHLSLGDKLVVHTAGSVSKEVLHNVSSRYGVLWPMKMIRKTMHELGPVNIVIDGNTETAVQQIQQLAGQFSDNITVAGDEMRLKMHLVAAVVSNFTNHLYHLAADYCLAEQIDFRSFYPIIEETVKQVQHTHPALVQAGPAFRKNTKTLEKHSRLLQEYPSLKKLYDTLSDSIMQTSA